MRRATGRTQHLDVADDALRDDVEIVVAVVLAGVGDVVVADHDHVFVGLLPHDPAGELAEPVGLEVLRDRGPRIRGDVLPLDSHELGRVDVHAYPSRLRGDRPRGVHRGRRIVTLAYRNGRYEAAWRCQRVGREIDTPWRASERRSLSRPTTVEDGERRQLACRPRAISSATFWPPFLPISSKCSCPYFSETASPPIFPMRP